MDRFGYLDRYGSSYSETDDRFGFISSPNVPFPEDVPSEKKPTFKIQVTTTGKVTRDIIDRGYDRHQQTNPIISNKDNKDCLKSREDITILDDQKSYCDKNIRPDKSEQDVYISLKALEKAFTSPWLQDYRHLGKCLIQALNDKKFPPERKPSFDQTKLTDIEGYSRFQPSFVDCSPDPKNITTFNGYLVYLSMFVTKEVQDKDCRYLLPFGKSSSSLTAAYIFSINITHPDDGDYLGKANGVIQQGKGNIVVFNITSLEDFTGQPISWSEIPLGSNLVASFAFNEKIFSSQLDQPQIIERDNPEIVDEEIVDDSNGNSNNDTIETLKPYFDGHSPDDGNYCQADNNWLTAKLFFPDDKLTSTFYIPFTDHRLDIAISLQDRDENLLGTALTNLDESGKVVITKVFDDEGKDIASWEDIKPHSLILNKGLQSSKEEK